MIVLRSETKEGLSSAMLGQSESSKLCNFDQTHSHIVGVLTRHSLSTRGRIQDRLAARLCLTLVPRSRPAARGSRSAVLPSSEALTGCLADVTINVTFGL